MVENPPGFVVRTEAQKAAWENGFRLERASNNGWLSYASTTAPVEIWLAGAGDRGPWFLSVSHRDVAEELGMPPAGFAGPGLATFQIATLTELHDGLDRVYRLAVSLPEVPLDRFRSEIRDLPRTTEAERLVVERIGQDVFRSALMDYWGKKCPITGIDDPALLRASHIVPWSECNDEQRLDVHNGLLLSALWDAAFDRGLVSFADDGTALFGEGLSGVAQAALCYGNKLSLIGLREAHLINLKDHRRRHGFS